MKRFLLPVSFVVAVLVVCVGAAQEKAATKKGKRRVDAAAKQVVAAAQEKTAGNPLNVPQGEAGVVPVGADGKPLNLNFESGTLEGWKAEGEAFSGQPVKGDIAALRPADRIAAAHPSPSPVHADME